MTQQPAAMLVAEIGSVTTRVTLLDAVDGEARLIGQAELPTTIDPPYDNPLVAVVEAALQIGEATGRRLVQDDALIVPQNYDQDGVNQVIVLTSASSPLNLVIAAVSTDVSARSALHASRATYTNVLQTITLNEGSAADQRGDGSWIERQVQTLLGLKPDAVLIAGGLEAGAEDALVRLAHIVGLVATAVRPEVAGARTEQALLPVVFAGNSSCRERVIEALSGKAATYVVDNVRPSLEVERLEPARRELVRLYNERLLPQLPGINTLRRLSSAPLRLSTEALGLMTRFLAERYKRDTLVVDVGASNTAAYLQSAGRYSPAVLGGVGVGYGLGALLNAHSLREIMSWLPFPITEQELTHRLLNTLLRPHIQPASREDLLISHAVARVALAQAASALADERPEHSYDMVVAGGSVLAQAPHPGLAALTLLDALQPDAESSVLAIDLRLDTLGLLGVCGALAFSNPDAALTLFERDLLNNTPLATCVVALGRGKPGSVALEAELQVVGGRKQTISVNHGQLGRLALAPGRRGQLTIRPAGNVRIGRNAPGQAVSSEVAAVAGSALGVVIDARGRPLALPEEPLVRQQLLWDWLVALGIEQGPLPYPAAERLPPIETAPAALNGRAARASQPSIPTPAEPAAPATPAPDASAPGRRISLTSPEPPSLESDLAKLRQTVGDDTSKKKRGLFGRK